MAAGLKPVSCVGVSAPMSPAESPKSLMNSVSLPAWPLTTRSPLMLFSEPRFAGASLDTLIASLPPPALTVVVAIAVVDWTLNVSAPPPSPTLTTSTVP